VTVTTHCVGNRRYSCTAPPTNGGERCGYRVLHDASADASAEARDRRVEGDTGTRTIHLSYTARPWPTAVLWRGNNAETPFPPLQLDVYTVDESTDPTEGSLGVAMLRLVGSWPLWGVIESMTTLVSPLRGQRDSVLIAFRDARVTVLSWNSNAHTLHTSSLHMFEDDPVMASGFTVTSAPPKVMADPEGRCAALLARGTKLIILPAGEASTLTRGERDPAAGSLAAAIRSNGGRGDEAGSEWSFAVDLTSLGIWHPRDTVFVHGTVEPVLVVLHEPTPTTDGLTHLRKDTCMLTGISLGLNTRKLPVVWTVEGLPHDAWKLEACPAGGVAVLTHYMVLHYAQGHGPRGVALSPNAYKGKEARSLALGAEEVQYLAAKSLAYEMATEPPSHAPTPLLTRCDDRRDLAVDLSAGVSAWIHPQVLAVSLADARVLYLQFELAGGGCHLIRPVARAPQFVASCMAALPAPGVMSGYGAASAYGALFAGGRTDDSFLFEYFPAAARTDDAVGDESLGAAKAEPTKKEEDQDMPETKVDADDVDVLGMLYGDGGDDGGEESGETFWELRELDRITGTAPFRDVALGDQADSGAKKDVGGSALRARARQLVCCVGDGDTGGALAVLRQGLALESVVDVEAPALTGVWAIRVSGDKLLRSPKDGGEGGPQDVAGFRSGCLAEHHGVLVASSPGEARFFQLGSGIREVTSDLSFELPGSLLCVETVCGGDLVVAVHPGGVELLEPCSQLLVRVASVEVEEVAKRLVKARGTKSEARAEDEAGVEVLSASVCGDIAALTLSDGTAALVHVVGGADRQGGCMVVDLSARTLELLCPDSPSTGISAVTVFHDDSGWVADCIRGPLTKVKMPDGGLQGAEEDDEDNDDEPTWCGAVLVVARECGSLEMHEITGQDSPLSSAEAGGYSETLFVDLSTCTSELLSVSAAADGPGILAGEARSATREDAGASSPTRPPAKKRHRVDKAGDDLPSPAAGGRHVVQVRMDVFGPCARLGNDLRKGGRLLPWARIWRSAAPILTLVMSDGAITVFRAFRPLGTNSLRFRRMDVRIPSQSPWMAQPREPAQLRRAVSRFDDLGRQEGACGLFVAGPVPTWVMIHRANAIVHPLAQAGGAVLSGCSIHMLDCPCGFVLATEANLSIAEPPSNFRLTTPWIQMTIRLRSTPLRACFYPQARLYAVAVRNANPKTAPSFRPLQEVPGTDPAAAAAYEVASAAAKERGSTGQFVRLLEPRGWRPIHQWMALAGENILALRPLVLKNEDGSSEPVIAVGTGTTHGEDFAVFGRTVFLTVKKKSNPRPEEAALGKVWDMSVRFSEEFKGAVTDIQQIEGRVVIAAGARIVIAAWTKSGLGQQQRAIFNRQDIIITGMRCLGPKLAVSDFVRGLRVLEYNKETEQVEQTAVNAGKLTPHAVEFAHAASNSDAILAASDPFGCLHLFAPSRIWSGKQLKHVGRIHIGKVAERLVPLPLPSSSPSILTGALLTCSLDGSLGILTPLVPAVADALRKVQASAAPRMVTSAGLHPAAFRADTGRGAAAPTRSVYDLNGEPGGDSIVDGDLLWRLTGMAATRQRAICDAAGQAQEEVLQTMEDLARAWLGIL